MCLIVLAFQVHPRFPLIVAANRDEFMDRPAEPAHWWPDAPALFAGRDLRAGGTWLGITRSGRFAAITNYRETRMAFPQGPSRGTLVRQALEHSIEPSATTVYAGFNLLYGPIGQLRYHNNIDGRDEVLPPGVHALSNHLLDTPWPKVVKATTAMNGLLDASKETLIAKLFALLTDDAIAPDDQLPDTGLPLEMERAASAILIRSPRYGTRCSTVLLVDAQNRAYVEERTWPGGGIVVEEFGVGRD
jgi:uncharacterized protein with NRDE domain